jgi:NAD(P)H dehydrogenase (quinone)
MAKALIAYVSVDGHTKQLADFIAEGVRMKGFEAHVMKISELKTAESLQGYDAYFLGCPTYHRDMTQNMKTFLFLMKKAELASKVAGAFGTYTHEGNAPQIILDTMEHVFKMNATTLGALNLLENLLNSDDGMKAGHDYAKAVVEMVDA